MDNQKLEEWGQEANQKYAEIVRKMNNGRGWTWNVFQTFDIFTDCDVLFVGLNPKAHIPIRDESGKIIDGYDTDFSHIGGILKGQWVSPKTLADDFDEFRNGKPSEEYGYFFDPKWKILKGLRFGDSNSFFTEVVRRGSWKLINYYPFGTNNEKELDAELSRLPEEDKKTIRRLNLDLYDILNPKLIIFLGKKALNKVFSTVALSFDNCHKDSMYVGEIADENETTRRAAILINHTSRHWLTADENQKIARMLGIEVGNLNIGKKNRLNAEKIKARAEKIKEGVVDLIKSKGYEVTDKKPNTTRFQFGKTLELTVTSTGNGTRKGYVALRHLGYKGNNKSNYNNNCKESGVDDIRGKLKDHKFNVSEEMWLGTKTFAAYGCTTEDAAINKIIQEIQVLEEELGQY